MVFYVFALQCVSTVAVVRRETNSWKWPFFQWLLHGRAGLGVGLPHLIGGRLLGWSDAGAAPSPRGPIHHAKK